MEPITRRILTIIQEIFTLGVVGMVAATLTHIFLLHSELQLIQLFIIGGLISGLGAILVYNYIKSIDFIGTIQLLTNYTFGIDTHIDEIMNELDNYCKNIGVEVFEEEGR